MPQPIPNFKINYGLSKVCSHQKTPGNCWNSSCIISGDDKEEKSFSCSLITDIDFKKLGREVLKKLNVEELKKRLDDPILNR